MEQIVIKKKTYKIIEKIDEHTYKVERENIKYICKSLGVKSTAYYDYLYAKKRLESSGINNPKVIAKDKKTGYVLEELKEGKTVFEILANQELSEDIYDQIFIINYRCKCSCIAIDFNPQNFILVDGNLYYMGYQFDEYTKSKDFTQTSIRLWNYTPEFRKLLKEKNIEINNERIKPDFEQNKEILMLTVKYYR